MSVSSCKRRSAANPIISRRNVVAATLAAAGVARVGIDAARGGDERGVVDWLRDQGIAVTVLQPVQINPFGVLNLRHAKTDRIVAALTGGSCPIAWCRNAIGS